MSFLKPFFMLCSWLFSEELVKIKSSKYNKSYSYYDSKGGIFRSCEKSKDAVTPIAQEGNAQEKGEIISSGSSSHFI